MKKIIIFLVIIIFFVQCEKDDLPLLVNQTISSEKEPIQSMTQLGTQLNNPYSVDAMQQANNNLVDSLGSSFPVINIYTTHYYVKFIPSNQAELENLQLDTILELFDYPMDYEVVEYGLYYHDPLLPDSVVNYQYCVVEEDHQFPNISYEILAELYIPELVEELNESTVEVLVNEALRITNNEPESVYKTDSKLSSWTPSGKIQAYDNVEDGLIPIEGVKVRARRWFIIKKGFTDSQGNFTTGSFKRRVKYSIKWQDKQFEIHHGWYYQAYCFGPKSTDSWNLNITSDRSLRIATIHRAAYRYHYKYIGDLKRPNLHPYHKLIFAYQHKDKDFNGRWFAISNLFNGVFPSIQIFRSADGTDREMNEIFSSAIHEIGHASHCELMNGGYIQMSQITDLLVESWAEAIQWYITKIEYNELGYSNYDLPRQFFFEFDSKQWWTSTSSHIYTPLYIDLVDDYNQSLLYEPNNQPIDKCPTGGSYDGTGCYLDSPPSGETAFIFSGHFYYTPVGECGCPITGSWFDNSNCYYRDIDVNELGYINNNSWYLMPAGNTDYPYDAINQYTMGYLESNIVKFSYGLSSLQTNLKSNKPTGLTDKYIDAYLNFYFSF